VKIRITMLMAIAAAVAIAGVLAGASGASQSKPSATARPAGASSGQANQVKSFAPPAACSPCLYYSGDFNAGDGNANGLSNENDGSIPGAEVWTPVTPDTDWLVTGLFENTLGNGTVDSTTPWAIRTGVSEGNGGNVYASGTGAANYTATGRSDFGFNEYTLFVPVSSTVILHQGVTYWVNVQPQCSGCAVRYFESNVLPAGSGANRIGPPDVLNTSFFNSAFFGANFTNANNEGSFSLFSFGVSGTPATGTLTVTKHLVSNPIDPSRFNLKIDGTTYAANIGNGGTTGAVTVLTGTHTVSETPGSFANPSNFASRIDCSDGSSGNGTSLSGVYVAPGGSTTCTITNTRKLFKV
jgi:hypothetical protein